LISTIQKKWLLLNEKRLALFAVLILVLPLVGIGSTISTVQAMPDVNTQLADESNKIKDKAVLLLYSDSDWSGSVLDTSHNSATRQGIGDTKIPFDCENKFFGLEKGIYSLSIQKGSESGYLRLAVIRDGKLLKEGSTTAAYGIVSFAGKCG
jgi:hypothetical protein